MSNLQHQTLALAGMFQSAALIDQLAHGNSINQAAFDCCLDSLFTLDSNSVQDIYGDGEGLMQGLKSLVDYLGGTNRSLTNKLTAYYILSMVKITGRLLADETMTKSIQQGLEDIQQQTQTFEMSPSGKLHKIDGLYQRTISLIKPRIIVQGEQVNLTNSDTTTRVRTLLFAGIRATVLWKQLGGSRLKLVFSRKKYVQQAEQLLRKL
jgi:high frequency lysogenization protein